MKQITSQSLAGLLSILLLCAGCDRNVSGSRLTPANYDQVNVGMNPAQVEKILGPPTKTETKQILVFGDQSRWEPETVNRYEDGTKFIVVTFRNDQMTTKDSNLGREP